MRTSVGCSATSVNLARPLLLASLACGMLVLADRGVCGRRFGDRAAATGAQLLWRVQSSLKLPRGHQSR